jgi:hypothetical protein
VLELPELAGATGTFRIVMTELLSSSFTKITSIDVRIIPSAAEPEFADVVVGALPSEARRAALAAAMAVGPASPCEVSPYEPLCVRWRLEAYQQLVAISRTEGASGASDAGELIELIKKL